MDHDVLRMALVGYESERKRIDAAISELRARFSGTDSKAPVGSPPKRRTMSAAGRKRIAAAQRARWAAIKKSKAEPKTAKRKLSAAGRKAIIKATRKRWAAFRKATKSKSARAPRNETAT
jgi:hypothetical protein